MVFNVLILYRTSLSSIQTEFLAGCKWVCKVVAKEIKGALGHQIQDSPLPRVQHLCSRDLPWGWDLTGFF